MCNMDLTTLGDMWLYQSESHTPEHHGRERAIVIGPKAHEVQAVF
jgi:hypothetical protein